MTDVWLAWGSEGDDGKWAEFYGHDKVLGIFANKEDAMKACTPDVVLFFEDRTAPKNIERWVSGNNRIEKWSVK